MFAIDTLCDSKSGHLEYFCSKCYYTLVNAYRQPSEVKDYIRPEEKRGYNSINQCSKPWMETVSVSECCTCSKFTSQGRGGRPPKRKKQARTVAATTMDTEGQGRCDTLNIQCSTSGQLEHTEQDTLPVPLSSPSQSVLCSDSQLQFTTALNSDQKEKKHSQCNTFQKRRRHSDTDISKHEMLLSDPRSYNKADTSRRKNSNTCNEEEV